MFLLCSGPGKTYHFGKCLWASDALGAWFSVALVSCSVVRIRLWVQSAGTGIFRMLTGRPLETGISCRDLR